MAEDSQFFIKTYKATANEIARHINEATSLAAQPFAVRDPLKKELIRFIAKGGKRFRPSLSLIVARAFGHDDIFPHLALETFHKYLLAHDDIIDMDTMRYGAPTIHAKMASLHVGEDSAHFGQSLALIAGDLICTVTNKIILNADLPAGKKIALLKAITTALDEVAWGWYDQFLMDYMPLDSHNLNFKRIERSIVWVTGKYSIKLPILFGLTVAGAPVPQGIEDFANAVGVLFQTGDDLIGLFGKIEDTGKSNFGDITQGKKTLPMWLSYRYATQADKKTLVNLVGKKAITQGEIEEVRSIIRRSGGLQKTEAIMADYRKKSLTLLKRIDLPTELKQFLSGFIYFLEKRDR